MLKKERIIEELSQRIDPKILSIMTIEQLNFYYDWYNSRGMTTIKMCKILYDMGKEEFKYGSEDIKFMEIFLKYNNYPDISLEKLKEFISDDVAEAESITVEIDELRQQLQIEEEKLTKLTRKLKNKNENMNKLLPILEQTKAKIREGPNFETSGVPHYFTAALDCEYGLLEVYLKESSMELGVSNISEASTDETNTKKSGSKTNTKASIKNDTKDSDKNNIGKHSAVSLTKVDVKKNKSFEVTNDKDIKNLFPMT